MKNGTRWMGLLAAAVLATPGARAEEAPGPAATGSPPPRAEGSLAATRARMDALVDALRVVLPLSLSERDFAAPANHDRIEAALRKLRDGASSLADHGQKSDVGFSHLSSTLARDAMDVHHRFVTGRTDEARFLLGELSSDCVACHARLPYKKDSAIGSTLWSSVDASKLPLDERVRLQVATRQFGPALDGYEALLDGNELSPAQLDLGGYLSDYLAIAIRVREDLPRARGHLAAWRQRPDLPAYLQDLSGIWVEALGSLDQPTPEGGELARAKSVLEQGKRVRRFPADRAGLVHDLVASGLLHRLVTRLGAPSPQSAEAYYLLGVTELRIGSSYWLTEPESYLEAAIRAAPGTPAARDAYVVLEESTWLGYTGSGSEGELPPEVAGWLGELRGLALGRTVTAPAP